MDRDAPVPRIQRNRDPAGMVPRAFDNEFRLPDRRSAEYDPRSSQFQPSLHSLPIANAASDLDLNAGCRDYGPNCVGVSTLAGNRPLQVDNVDPFASRRLEFTCLPGRVVSIDGRSIEIATEQPHTAPPLEIDGGIQKHQKPQGSQRRKLAISRNPAFWLFSG